jgi:hypothetical protein
MACGLLLRWDLAINSRSKVAQAADQMETLLQPSTLTVLVTPCVPYSELAITLVQGHALVGSPQIETDKALFRTWSRWIATDYADGSRCDTRSSRIRQTTLEFVCPRTPDTPPNRSRSAARPSPLIRCKIRRRGQPSRRGPPEVGWTTRAIVKDGLAPKRLGPRPWP